MMEGDSSHKRPREGEPHYGRGPPRPGGLGPGGPGGWPGPPGMPPGGGFLPGMGMPMLPHHGMGGPRGIPGFHGPPPHHHHARAPPGGLPPPLHHPGGGAGGLPPGGGFVGPPPPGLPPGHPLAHHLPPHGLAAAAAAAAALGLPPGPGVPGLPGMLPGALPGGILAAPRDKKPPTRGNAEVVLRNDYCQHFVDSGRRPQNFVRDASVEDRFKLYPKVQRLIDLKDHLVAHRATPPMYVDADLRHFDFAQLGCQFDVLLVDPPWEEYARRGARGEPWTVEEIERLPLEAVGASPSYLFLWCGSGGRLSDTRYHLDEGRRLLRKWGYRRCEDVTWLKTNRGGQANAHSELGVLAHTKEHCLVGIKGTVRRSVDVNFIHANVDTDVVVGEEPADPGDTSKPEELYKIIEHFCLGRRRLELFGRIHNIRPGWVTVGNELHSSNYNREAYLKEMTVPGEAADGTPVPGHLVGNLTEIEEMRPRSPGARRILRPPAPAPAAAPAAAAPAASAAADAGTLPPPASLGPPAVPVGGGGGGGLGPGAAAGPSPPRPPPPPAACPPAAAPPAATPPQQGGGGSVPPPLAAAAAAAVGAAAAAPAAAPAAGGVAAAAVAPRPGNQAGAPPGPVLPPP